MITFETVTGPLQNIMGVKAVWGHSEEPVMCFGSRGDPALKDKKHYMLAHATAAKAVAQPYLVTIGGGERVSDELDGRVIDLVRVTGAYGETSAFVKDPIFYEELRQWPVAVILLEAYEIEGAPHLIHDLGFPDRRILANAYDGVRRDDEDMQRLYNALRSWPVRRRENVRPPPGFRDPRRVVLCGSLYPKPTATEGKRLYEQSRQLERSGALSRAAKEENRARNGGIIICEACDLADENAALFDAHHLQPLATGIRESRVDDFVVLCPTCHRWAHYKAAEVLEPLKIDELRRVRQPPPHSRRLQLEPFYDLTAGNN